MKCHLLSYLSLLGRKGLIKSCLFICLCLLLLEVFRKSQLFTNVLFCWNYNSIFIKQTPWSSLTCFPNSVNAMGPFYKDTAMTQPVGNCSAVWIQICLYHKMWRWLWILEATKWAILEYFPNFQPHCCRVIGSSALTAQPIIKVTLDLKATTGWTHSLPHVNLLTVVPRI